MNKVYIVTDGDYSSYHIEKVFSDPEKARIYQMMHCPYGWVEPYDIDTVECAMNDKWIIVKYDVRRNVIDKIEIVNKKIKKNYIKFDMDNVYFHFLFHISDKRIYTSIISKGTESKLLLKSAQDTFAKWMYEHGKNKEELLNEAKEKWKKKWGHMNYIMYSTSLPEIPKQDPVCTAVDAQLREMIANGQELPENLSELFNKAKENEV